MGIPFVHQRLQVQILPFRLLVAARSFLDAKRSMLIWDYVVLIVWVDRFMLWRHLHSINRQLVIPVLELLREMGVRKLDMSPLAIPCHLAALMAREEEIHQTPSNPGQGTKIKSRDLH